MRVLEHGTTVHDVAYAATVRFDHFGDDALVLVGLLRHMSASHHLDGETAAAMRGLADMAERLRAFAEETSIEFSQDHGGKDHGND